MNVLQAVATMSGAPPFSEHIHGAVEIRKRFVTVQIEFCLRESSRR